VPPELRQAVMAAANPRVVLRNWVAQTAITAAELGHDDVPRRLLGLLQRPFDGAGDAALEVPAAVAAAAGRAAAPRTTAGQATQSGGDGDGAAAACVASVRLAFDTKPPAWAVGLCVTCSS
jgi:hypothetical protein